jgi:hypothetical protein
MRLRVPEQCRPELDGAYSIGHAVVYAPDERRRAVLQLLDDVERPQRPVAVEALRHEAGDDLAEPLAVHRSAGRDGPHVVRDVEHFVVDPHRVRDSKRGFGEPAAKAGCPVQASRDVPAKLFDARRRFAPARLQDHELAGVPADVPGLELQDLRVLIVQAIDVQSCRPSASIVVVPATILARRF